jgi:serine/threonine protein phosphatase PrpC
MDVSTTTQCRTCGVAVGDDAVFCEACGARVDPGPADPKLEPGCHVCGAAPDAIAADGYCTTCGAREAARRERVELNLGAVAGVSDRGIIHTRNDDAFDIQSNPAGIAAVVCDGVSMSVSADLAARRAAEAAGLVLAEALRNGAATRGDAISVAATAAQEAVERLGGAAADDSTGPACTLVASVYHGGELSVGWVGDSRGYWLTHDRALQLTVDDSWAGEQVLSGRMSEAEAAADPRARSITRWIGSGAPEEPPRVVSLRPSTPGLLVLCSDGLSISLPTAEDVARAVRRLPEAASPLAVARSLADHALAAGGQDNITVVVVEVRPR